MSKKQNQWDNNAQYGSDILGVGSYQNLPKSGVPKNKTQIGFIRKPPARPIRKQHVQKKK
jgi:hypothetical protein